MTYTSTFRQDIRVALAAALEAFRTANPSLLRQTYRARPGTLHPPCAFVGTWREPTIALDAQLSTRLPSIELLLVQGTYDNAETMDRQDALTDAAVSYFGDKANAHVSTGVIVAMSLEDTDLTLSGADGSSATYLVSVLTLQLDTQEGL